MTGGRSLGAVSLPRTQRASGRNRSSVRTGSRLGHPSPRPVDSSKRSRISTPRAATTAITAHPAWQWSKSRPSAPSAIRQAGTTVLVSRTPRHPPRAGAATTEPVGQRLSAHGIPSPTPVTDAPAVHLPGDPFVQRRNRHAQAATESYAGQFTGCQQLIRLGPTHAQRFSGLSRSQHQSICHVHSVRMCPDLTIECDTVCGTELVNT